MQDGIRNENWKYGLIDTNGKKILPIEYDEIGAFREGLAPIYLNDEQGSKWGFIYKAGNFVIPLMYEMIETDAGYNPIGFVNGVAEVCKDGKWIKIDTSGKEMGRNNEVLDNGLKPIYSDITDISDFSDMKVGFTDRDGNIVIEQIYDINEMCYWFGLSYFVNDTAVLSKNGLYGVLDNQGNTIISFQYESIEVFSKDIWKVGNNGKYGLVNRENNIVLPIEYDEIETLYENMAVFKTNEKYGYIDGSGKIVISEKFDYAGGFENGYACVSIDGENGFIDNSGDLLFTYDYNRIGSFSEGLIAVGYEKSLNRSYDGTGSIYADNAGYVDSTGKIVIPLIYNHVFPFSNGLAWVGIEDNNYNTKYGIIDTTGTVVLPLEYDSPTIPITTPYDASTKGSFDNEFVWIRKDGKYGILQIQTVKSEKLIATPTSSRILVNGSEISFDAYTINGNNYFKLRDIAYILNGTEAQFEVIWNGEQNAIELYSDKAYTTVGGEMTGKGAGEKYPVPSNAKIKLDEQEITLSAYTIENNNYFKLRDLGIIFDFDVTWDGANNAIIIDTSSSYTPD